jgi:Fe-Mn family superoxide dismutase
MISRMRFQSVEVLKTVFFLITVAFVMTLGACRIFEGKPTIVMERLAYSENALEPFIHAQTMNLHYGKHYAAYVAAANRLLKGSRMEGKSAPEIIALTSGDSQYTDIFNNVAQAWNHSFFWKSLKPGGGGVPQGKLANKINEAFGSFSQFQQVFLKTAGSQFASGWVWLVVEGDKLKVMTTANADTPLAHGMIPLFGVDLWEHAYYLDYRHRREEFVKAVLDNLANWDFAASQLEIYSQ